MRAGRTVTAFIIGASVLALAGPTAGAERSERLKHTSSDPMKCKVCRPAYEKAVAHVRKHLRRSSFAVKMVAAWTLLADGRYADDLEHCVDAAVGWRKQGGYNERSHSGNW